MASLNPIVSALLLVAASPAAGDPVVQWGSYIAEASVRFGVPQDWIRNVMVVESGGRLRLNGNPLTSSAGAMGLMQLMPGTWDEMRSRLGLGSDPFNARDNILAGAAYLRAMYDRFGYPGLFAAYDAGPERYAEHITLGSPLPPETRAYVARLAGRSHNERPAAQTVRALPNLFVVGTPPPDSAAPAISGRSVDRLFVIRR